MDRIDIGIEMWYQYWYRYWKICNDMQPYWRLNTNMSFVVRQKAIISTNVDQDLWYSVTSFGLNKLMW